MTTEHPPIESLESLDLVAQAERDYLVMLQHVIFFRSASGPDNAELREDGTYELREDGTYELRE